MTTIQQLTGATIPTVTNDPRPEVQADTIAMQIADGMRAADTGRNNTKVAKDAAKATSEKEENATLAFFAKLGTDAFNNRWQVADCTAAILQVKNSLDSSNSIMDKKSAGNFLGYVTKVLDPAARDKVAGFVKMSADAYGADTADKDKAKEHAKLMRDAYGARYHYVAFLCKEATEVAAGKLLAYVPTDGADCRRMAGIKITDRKYVIPNDVKALERITAMLVAMEGHYQDATLKAAREALAKLDATKLGTAWDIRHEMISAEQNANEAEQARLQARIHSVKASVADAMRKADGEGLGIGELPAPTAPATPATPLAGAFDPLSDPLIRQLMAGQQQMQMQMSALMDKLATPAPKATRKAKDAAPE